MINLEDLENQVQDKLAGSPEVSSSNEFPNLANGEAKRKWFKVDGVMVVFADLKNSTSLGVNKHDKSTARIYEASTGVGVNLLQSFNPKYVEVQGDGFFGVFHDDGSSRLAITAAMMLAYFSQNILEPRIRKAMEPKCPRTGLKVGVATGQVLVKQIGTSGLEKPVWAGKPVNHAAKCAEGGDAHQIVVTRGVYDKVIGGNDFLEQPCYHPGHPKHGFSHSQPRAGSMWHYKDVTGIPDRCLARDVPWCSQLTGEESVDQFMEKVIAGEKIRKTTWFQRNLA